MEDAQVEPSNSILRIHGKLNPKDLLKKNDIIDMSFLDRTNGDNKQKIYKCTVIDITPQCILQCDTNSQSLTTSNKDLHLSSGISDGILLTL